MLDFASEVRIRKLILVFGILNACLFCGLQPLWEGFDEAFHYSYVETLWQTHRLPVLGRTLVPGDVSASFELAPASHVVTRWIPQATAYDVWFGLPEAEKERRRQALDSLRPVAENGAPNYEAHHPPLAYVALALVDGPMSGAPLTFRVTALRLVGAVFSIVLLYFGTIGLCRAFGLSMEATNAVLFVMFCSEMLYATIAHVANDWLAVGISPCFWQPLRTSSGSPSGVPHCAPPCGLQRDF